MRPDSIKVALGYDAAGRPNAVSFDRGTLTLGYSSTTGNLNRIRTPEGDSLLFTYDGSLSTQVRWSGLVEGTVGVVYDNDFRVAAQTVNGTDTVHFNYDADGLLLGAGGLVLGRSATSGLLLADTLGRVRSGYQYSSRGELNGYRVKHDTTTLFATGYVRDSLGRIVQLFDTTQSTPTRWSFVYDSVGRLVKDSVNGAVFHVFTYDANGNRLSYTSGAGTVNYSYDSHDRLLWARVGTDTTHYTYGSNGELRTKTVPGVGTTTYSYDALGNLIAVVLPDSTEIEYVIDGQNRRVGRKVDGDLVQSWLYQNQLNPIAELDSTGAVVSRFVYGSRANVPDFMLRGDSVFRLVTDHLGSVRLVVDTASGDVVQRLDYDEWGNVTTNTNPAFQPLGFAGGLLDESSSLLRFGARDYSPSDGRWRARDPIGIGGGVLNLYAYAGNDPINRIDPSGLCRIDVGFKEVRLFGGLLYLGWHAYILTMETVTSSEAGIAPFPVDPTVFRGGLGPGAVIDTETGPYSESQDYPKQGENPHRFVTILDDGCPCEPYNAVFKGALDAIAAEGYQYGFYQNSNTAASMLLLTAGFFPPDPPPGVWTAGYYRPWVPGHWR